MSVYECLNSSNKQEACLVNGAIFTNYQFAVAAHKEL